MQLPTQSNQFLFHLPVGFLSPSIESRWMPMLRKNKVFYPSVLDYLNSTIRGLTFPGMSFNTTEQTTKTKKIAWKDVQNIYDNFTKEIDVTFQAVDSNINHLIMVDALTDIKLDTEKLYAEPLTFTVLDKYRDVIANVKFNSINIRSLSDIQYSFADISLEDKTFTMTFAYNYINVEMLLEKADIIKEEIKGVPPKTNIMN